MESTTPLHLNFYGDNVRWFVGTVVDNDDTPTTIQLTRVKVRAFGIHDNIPDDKLPWASVVLPTTEGGVYSGRAAAMDIDAQVFGIFLDGANSQYPLVLGSIPYARTSWEELNSFTGGGLYPTENGRVEGDTLENAGPRFRTGPAIDPNEAALITYQFFRSRGYNDAQARGIYGNLAHESANFRQDVVDLSSGTDLDGNSYGIAQWRGSRLEELITFARERNLAAGSLDTQLQFVAYELDTYSYLGKTGLLRCTNAGQAAVHFMRKYERPAPDPSNQRSPYPNPVWSNNIPTLQKRYGEDDRVDKAVLTTFESTPAQRTIS